MRFQTKQYIPLSGNRKLGERSYTEMQIAVAECFIMSCMSFPIGFNRSFCTTAVTESTE